MARYHDHGRCQVGVILRRDTLAHVEIPHDSDFNRTNFTLSLDARIEYAPAVGESFVFVSKGGLDSTTTSNFWFAYRNDSGTMQLRAGFWDATAGAVAASTCDIDLGTGRWYRLAAVWDHTAKTLKIYYGLRGDGRSVSLTLGVTGSHALAVPATQSQLVRIGCDVSSASALQNACYATVSDVEIHSSALAQSVLEGRAPYHVQGGAISIVGCWTFDEGEGATARDLAVVGRTVAGGNDGTLKNGAEWGDSPQDCWYARGLAPSAGATGIAHADPPPAIIGCYSHTRTQGATVTASDAATGYAASRLRAPRKTTTTRTANVTGAKTWVFDFGRERTIGAVSIYGWNVTSAALVKVQLHTADSWGAPAVDLTMPPTLGSGIYLFDRPWLYRYARLSITDAANPDVYIELGTVDWWQTLDLPQPIDAGRSAMTIGDASTSVQMLHGASVWRTQTTGEDWSFTCPDLRRSQADELQRMIREGGDAEARLIVHDPRRGLPRSTYGYLTGLGSVALADPAWNRQSVTGISIEADR